MAAAEPQYPRRQAAVDTMDMQDRGEGEAPHKQENDRVGEGSQRILRRHQIAEISRRRHQQRGNRQRNDSAHPQASGREQDKQAEALGPFAHQCMG